MVSESVCVGFVRSPTSELFQTISVLKPCDHDGTVKQTGSCTPAHLPSTGLYQSVNYPATKTTPPSAPFLSHVYRQASAACPLPPPLAMLYTMQRVTRALILKQYSEDQELAVGPANLPLLQPNQVLVRMEYATVSVQDLSFLQGHCPVVRSLPAVPGFEGSGTVVETGSKLKNWRFQGKRVAVFALDPGLQGTWSEYAVVHSRHCFLLSDSIPFDQAASLFTRPLTVSMFEEMISKHHSKAIIQTGGASNLCKMTLRMCNYHSIPCVCVISQPEEATDLAELGAKYILLSSDPLFSGKATDICEELGVSVGFDSIGGAVAGLVFNALTPGGVLYTYEDSLEFTEITDVAPKSLIFEQKKIVGLNLFPWFERKHSLQKLHLMNRIQQLHSMYRPEVIGVFPMHEVLSAVQLTREQGRRGKVLIQLRTLPIVKPSDPDHKLAEITTLEEEKIAEEPVHRPVAIAVEAVEEDEEPEELEIEHVTHTKAPITLEVASDDEDVIEVEQGP